MIKYLVKRILLIVPAVLVILFILYSLIYFLPGSSMAALPIEYGGDALDSFFTFINAGDNFFTKFVRYIYNIIVHQDFGGSAASRYGLMGSMVFRIQNTVFLLLSGIGTTMIIGIPVGIYAAVRKGRAGDRAVSAVMLFMSTIPAYSIAMVLALIICVYLGWLPVLSSYKTPQAYILPAVTIALGGISSVARMTRAGMIEVLEQPYILALRSKGLKETSVIWEHALKNAMVPIISTLGGYFAQLLCGTLVVEQFFNVPGLGSFMLNSLSFRNHFEILGCAAVLTTILMCINIAADILYTFVNPRIRLRYTGGQAAKKGKEAA